jgi:hypothetical protein
MTTLPATPHRSMDQWAVAVMASVLAVGNMLLGVLILGTDWGQRLSGPSFTAITDIAPGWAWGAAWLAAGVLSLYGQVQDRLWPARVGHSAAAFIALFWTVAFIYGALKIPTVAPTGIAAYLTIAALHLVASVAVHRGGVVRR